MRPDNPIVIRRFRGGELESLQRGAWVRVELGRGVTGGVGAPEQWVYGRSATKALQAVPLVESGAAAQFGFDRRHLALAMASHSGEADHIAVAADGLAKLGLGPADLRCGDQRPLAAGIGAPKSALAHNCSGKHVGFLAVCSHLGQDPATYLDLSGRTQQLVNRTAAELTGCDDLGVAIDGCSAPTFRMPLSALALGIARIATPRELAPARRAACESLIEASGAEPHLIGGTDRFCTELIAATNGALVAKVGAEAVYVVGVVASGVGYAAKLDDGYSDSVCRLITALLAAHGVLDANQLERLGTWADPQLRNAAGLVVGHEEFPLL